MKPILFNTQMVRANLAGLKTTTRRLIKPRYRDDECGFQIITNAHTGEFVRVEKISDQGSGIFPDGSERYVNPPYRPGDILYVRETWRVREASNPPSRCTIEYKAGGTKTFNEIIALPTANGEWKPSIHMPKKAARLFLRVTNVRVERLQEIDAAGIRAEGLLSMDAFVGDPIARDEFRLLWDSTVRPEEAETCGWSANPWVWVIEYEKCEKQENEG